MRSLYLPSALVSSAYITMLIDYSRVKKQKSVEPSMDPLGTPDAIELAIHQKAITTHCILSLRYLSIDWRIKLRQNCAEERNSALFLKQKIKINPNI